MDWKMNAMNEDEREWMASSIGGVPRCAGDADERSQLDRRSVERGESDCGEWLHTLCYHGPPPRYHIADVQCNKT